MTHEQLIFNRTNASNLLNVLPHHIRKVEVWANCVFVTGKKLSRFVSKRKFYLEFVSSRKERAKELKVTSLSDSEFIVCNPKSNNNYLVELQKSTIVCGCQDYQYQMNSLGKACCKHSYAVLFSKGFDSLGDYQKSVKL